VVEPPFQLVRDGEVMRGRGRPTTRGVVVLQMARAFVEQEGALPPNVKFLFEGEEEIGSPHLGSFVEEHARELACDLVISADGAM
jgi:acetylornithine deacetylase/succinyl-diaminopimelate desuccinylase-like protein